MNVLMNLYNIYLLWKMRQPVPLPEQYKVVYEFAFREDFNPRDFLRLVHFGTVMALPQGMSLTHKGEVPKKLYLVLNGRVDVKHHHFTETKKEREVNERAETQRAGKDTYLENRRDRVGGLIGGG